MTHTAHVSSEKISGTYVRPRYLSSVSKKGLSDAQIERVLAVLSRRIERVHGGNTSALAKELKISQPALWQVMNRRTRPSYGTAETLAKLEGLAVESILNSPRERAAALAREGGLSAAAIARVMSEPEPAQERPVLWWIARMQLADQQLRLDAPPASAPVPTSSPRRSVA